MTYLTEEQAQQIEEALESCKTVIKDLIDDKYKSKAIVLEFADKALTNIRAARAQEQAEQTQPDSFCQESDGCPTELAVLQRFWREKQAEQEPVAWRVRGYNQFKTGDPAPWRYVDGVDKPSVNKPDCCDFEQLYAAPVRTKDLTDDEIRELVKQVRFDGKTDRTFQFARAVIAADREKNK